MEYVTEKYINKALVDLGGQKLRVLAYHEITDVPTFKKHLNFLQKHYNIVSLEQFKNFLDLKEKLPKNPLLITSDDGDISLYENAFPVLKKEGIPAAVFVITELLDTKSLFWWDEIVNYFGKESGNKKVWEVKEWPNHKRLEFLTSLREERDHLESPTRQLTSEQTLEMHKGGVSIANHSHSHPMFNQCSKEEIVEEMEKSICILESLGLESKIFAYPNGNYSIDAEKILVRNGVKAAFLFDHKINSGILHPMRISRLVVNDSTPLWKLRFILSGWHSRILPLTRKLGKLLK